MSTDLEQQARELARLHRIGQYVRSKNIIVHEYPIEEVPLDEHEKRRVGELNALFYELFDDEVQRVRDEGAERAKCVLKQKYNRAFEALSVIACSDALVSRPLDPTAMRRVARRAMQDCIDMGDSPVAPPQKRNHHEH